MVLVAVPPGPVNPPTQARTPEPPTTAHLAPNMWPPLLTLIRKLTGIVTAAPSTESVAWDCPEAKFVPRCR
jgi:hypothetical protein